MAEPGATRAAAALAVTDVLGAGRALDEALARRLHTLDDGRDRALAQEMAYGVLRLLPRLQALSAALLQRPLKARDRDLGCLLYAGLYQLLELRVPAHAAVSETVAGAARLGKPWAGKLVNAVLRNFQRRREELLAPLDGSAETRLCFPAWLLARLRHDWPQDWEGIAAQSNRHPPMTLRVNPLQTESKGYAAELAAAGFTARPSPHAEQALVLDRPVDVERLPGFGAGRVSVQDAAAQLAAGLLDAGAGEQVLDACAAPGGKSAHLLERTSGIELTAVDVNAARLHSVESGLQRLGLSARLVTADMTEPAGAWTDRRYQRILLDVPCSATGVIRRHPDIKWLRRDADIARLAQTQRRILDTVWPHLTDGGMLVYVTCSLLAEENHEQMQAFLQRTPDAVEIPIDAAWGRACRHGRQILTGEDAMDGFYFARLAKRQ